MLWGGLFKVLTQVVPTELVVTVLVAVWSFSSPSGTHNSLADPSKLSLIIKVRRRGLFDGVE